MILMVKKQNILLSQCNILNREKRWCKMIVGTHIDIYTKFYIAKALDWQECLKV